MITYPKAEAFARSCELFTVTDPVTKELYGYALAVLDEAKHRRVLIAHGFLGAEQEAAIAVLKERVDRINAFP